MYNFVNLVKEKNKDGINYAVYIFNLTLILYVLYTVVEAGSWNINPELFNQFRKITVYLFYIFAILTFGIEEITNKFSFKYLIVATFLVGSILLISLNLADKTLFNSILMIVLTKNRDFYKIVNFYFKLLIYSTVVIVLCSFIGLTKDVVINFSYGVGHSLGFSHPNNLGTILFILVVTWLYLNSHKSIGVIFLVSYAIAIFDWLIPLSRTSSILLLVLPFLIIFYRWCNTKRIKKIFYFISSISFLISFLVSFYLMFRFSLLDANSSNLYVRFTDAHQLYNLYGIHWLGNKISFVSTIESMRYNIPSVILDNAYLRLLIYYGKLASIIYIIIFLIIGFKIDKNSNPVLMAIYLLFVIHGFMEYSMLLVQWNFLLLGVFANFRKVIKNNEKIFEN